MCLVELPAEDLERHLVSSPPSRRCAAFEQGPWLVHATHALGVVIAPLAAVRRTPLDSEILIWLVQTSDLRNWNDLTARLHMPFPAVGRGQPGGASHVAVQLQRRWNGLI